MTSTSTLTFPWRVRHLYRRGGAAGAPTSLLADEIGINESDTIGGIPGVVAWAGIGDNGSGASTSQAPIGGQAFIDARVQAVHVASIAAMRLIPVALLPDGYLVEAKNYYAPGDFGGGKFVWSVASTAAADNGLVILPLGSTGVAAGRWLRNLGGLKQTLAMFGAQGAPALDTAPLQAFLNAGGGRLGAGTWLHNATLVVPAGTEIIGDGPLKSIVRLSLAAGAPVVNGILTERTSVTGNTGLHFEGFTYDHNASALADPTSSPRNDPLFGVAVVIRTSNALIRNCAGLNSWDICWEGLDFDETSATPAGGSHPPQAGMPRNITFDTIYTSNCGCGNHTVVQPYNTIPGKVGGAVVNGSSSYFTAKNCFDYLSYGGYGTDTGGGAYNSIFENCASAACLADPANQTSQSIPASGTPFFNQSNNAKYTNCHAEFPAAMGFYNGDGCIIEVVNSSVRGSGYMGIREAGSGKWTNVVVTDASQASAHTYDSIEVIEASVSLAALGPRFIGIDSLSDDGKARYGYSETPIAPHTIASEIIGGTFQGASGAFGNLTTTARVLTSALVVLPGFLKGVPSAGMCGLDLSGSTTSALILAPTGGSGDIALEPSVGNKVGLYGNTSISGGLGIFGSAIITTKPTVTGAKGGNAALASLIAALASYGLIADNSTA